MPRSERGSRAVLAGVLGLAGCAIPLEDRSFPPGAPAAGPTVVDGCALLPGLDGPPSSAGRSIVLGDDRIWLFAGTRAHPAPLLAIASATADPCTTGARAVTDAFDASALAGSVEGAVLGPRDVATDGARAWAFVDVSQPDPSAPLGLRALGTAIAAWDASSKRFVVRAPLLFTADRPTYGVSAIVHDGDLWAYGCLASGDPFRRPCTVARAPLDHVDEPTAWSFFAGGGAWSSSNDDARPLFDAGDSLAVRRDGARWLVTWVPPLGREVDVRSGSSPLGPWSRAYPLFGCAPSIDAPANVCVGAGQHGGLAPLGTLAITTKVTGFFATLDPEPWPRLQRVAVPSDVP